MAKRTRRTRRQRTSGRQALIALLAIALGAVLLWGAFELRRIFFPERTRLDVDRTLRPGHFEERARWVEGDALAVLDSLASIVAGWDTTRGSSGLRIDAVLAETTPLEEGNRLVAKALLRRGAQILDAVETEGVAAGRMVDLTFGLESRTVGHLTLSGRRRERPSRETKVALVLTDLEGAPASLADVVFALDFPMTLALAPTAPRSADLAERAHQASWDVIARVPMEPVGYPQRDPGREAVLVDMEPSGVTKLIEKHLRAVPFASGITNYMGSMATTDRTTMTAVFDVLSQRGLFFLDARTSNRSIAPKIARERRLPCLEADLTLDTDPDDQRIRMRMGELVDLARDRDGAIGTFQAAEDCVGVVRMEVKRLAGREVRFVRLSDLDAGRWIGSQPASAGR